jgi:asparagine synthase (glutamine-hydrolysing)
MVQPLRRRPDLREASLRWDSGELGVVYRDPIAPVAQHDGIRLAYFGVILAPDNQPVGGMTLAETLLERYRLHGERGLYRLNGSYVIAVWDEDAQRLTLVCDELGAGSLAYWPRPDGLLFASELKSIAWHPGLPLAVNETAVADFFLRDMIIGERTWLQDVHMLPAGGVATWHAGQFEVHSYWDLPVGEYRAADPQTVGRGWADSIRAAVGRALTERNALLVTAGLDSRVIAEAARQVRPDLTLQTASIGRHGCIDVRYGAQIAAELRYPHAHLPLGTDYLEHYAGRAAWRAEGRLNAYAAWIYAAEPWLQEVEADRVLTGLFGNTVEGRIFPAGMAEAESAAQGERVLRGLVEHKLQALQEVMRPEVFRRAAEASIETRLSIFRGSRGRDSLARYDELQFRGSVLYHAQREWVLGDGAEPVDMFLDNQLVRYSLSVPPALRAGGKLFRQVVASEFPRVARLPEGRTGHSLVDDLRRQSNPLLAQAERLMRRARRRVGARGGRDVATNCVPHNSAIREGSRDFVVGALAETESYADLFDPAAVQRVLADHLAGRRSAYLLLGALLTFSLWRRLTIAERVGVSVGEEEEITQRRKGFQDANEP